jgi:transcriptional regulator with XRE-family HTH domain
VKYKTFLQRLKDIRRQRGLSQENVAELLGTDQSNFGRKERGVIPLTVEELLLMLPMFNLEPDVIFHYPAVLTEPGVIKCDVFFMARGGDPI